MGTADDEIARKYGDALSDAAFVFAGHGIEFCFPWNGDLDDFKKDAPVPVAGIGALPILAGWALAALGIAVVLGLAYLLYVLKVASPIQNKVIEYCDKLAKNGSPEDIRTCVAALQSMEKNGNPDLLGFLGDALKPIITVLAIGVAIYVGAMFLPGILARRKAAA